jgi:hypothetical protein
MFLIVLHAFCGCGLLRDHLTIHMSSILESGMAIVRFAFNTRLVEVRREVCPSARFEKTTRQWIMTDKEAERFVRAAHSRFEFIKCQARIMVDADTWVVGFVQGAPFCIKGSPAVGATALAV